MSDKQTTVRMSTATHDKLREISYINRIAINTIILNAINMYIESKVIK